MDKFTQKVLETIRRNELIPEGTPVTVGFSGGADSMCLLYVLNSLTGLLKCSVNAVHVNHNLRGPEALRDQEFCRDFCASHDIPFEAVSVDVNGYVSEHGLSTEEAARILRYEALTKKAEETGAVIAVAHHSEDQAETILLNMLRGTGAKGLSGMSYRRDNIIRPLLDVSKEDILSFINEQGLSFVTDSTNLENDYARNRIRNEIMPALKGINVRAAEHICLMGEKSAEADAYIRNEAEEYVKENAAVSDGEVRLPRKKLALRPQIFRRYVIITCISLLGVPLKDWGETHFSDIEKALTAKKGYHTDLPMGVKADNTYTEIILKASGGKA